MAATEQQITERLQAATLACHPLLCRLNEIGNVRSFSGGRTIVQELEFPVLVDPKPFAESTWYNGYEVLTPGQWTPLNELHKTCTIGEEMGVFTAAEYPIRQAAVMLYEKGYDPDDIDPVEECIKSAAKMTAETITVGSRHGINSLPLLVSRTPTIGIIGGIDRQRHIFWRNLAISHDGRIGYRDMMHLMLDRLSIVEGMGSKASQKPDLILMGKEDFDACAPKEKTKTKYDDWGFESFEFEGTAVVLDPNIKPWIENYSIFQSRIYFLHTKYFHWRSYADRNWSRIDQDRFSKQAVGPLPDLYSWAGNLSLNCSYVQGVLYRKTC
jgi:hypothetical protein